MIEETRCFTVSPTHATLLPGDVLTLTVTYEHHSLLFGGCHSMPLLMKLGERRKNGWMGGKENRSEIEGEDGKDRELSYSSVIPFL